MKTCKEKKKETEEQAKKEKEEQQAQKKIEDEWGDLAHDYGDGDVSVFCDRGQHYTKAKNIIISEGGRNVCAGCMVARDYSSSAIKKIKNDGTVIYKDGSIEY